MYQRRLTAASQFALNISKYTATMENLAYSTVHEVSIRLLWNYHVYWEVRERRELNKTNFAGIRKKKKDQKGFAS